MASMNDKLRSEMIKASRAKQAEESSTKALIDQLYSDGVSPDELKAPAKGEDRTFFEAAKEAVVAGFSKVAQALLAADVKALSDEQKISRKYWQQQINSTLGDWKSSLEKRIARENAIEGGEEKKKSSPETMMKKQLLAIITRAEKLEASTIKDLAKFISELKSASARIPE